MSDEELREMIRAILGEADYDLAKHFDPETSEDIEEAEITMKRMVKIARKAGVKAKP